MIPRALPLWSEMGMTVIPDGYQQQLEDAITGQLPHIVTPDMTCQRCGYVWTAVYPVGSLPCVCPKCGKNPMVGWAERVVEPEE